MLGHIFSWKNSFSEFFNVVYLWGTAYLVLHKALHKEKWPKSKKVHKVFKTFKIGKLKTVLFLKN